LPHPFDIKKDIMWTVELEPEVEKWMLALPMSQFGLVLPLVERLAEIGNQMSFPHSKSLGAGLFELRFNNANQTWRITYYFANDRRIVLLTVFAKQRLNERHQIQRARHALTRCQTEHFGKDHTS
jgi:phage-related protein